MRTPLHVEERRVTIYPPGAQPAFPDGLYAGELIIPAGLPPASKIQAVYDPFTRTIKLFVEELP